MLTKRFSLLFYLKKQKGYLHGKQMVYMRITIDSTRTEVSTQRSCEPERWNSHSGRAKGTKEEVRVLNAFLDSMQVKVFEIHRNLLDSEEPITGEIIKKRLQGVKDNTRMILEVFKHHNEQVKQLVGKEFSSSTAKRYKTSLDHTRSFIEWKYKVPDIDITKLNFEFISEYAFWLKSIRNCNHNSTMKYLTNFKKIVLLCLKNGWLDKDPFLGFNLSKKEVERPFLTATELKIITAKKFSIDRLNQVRDIFLFSCFTGLAYVDVSKLRRTELGVGHDSDMWIFTKRQKTHTASKIPLLPTALEILKRYENDPHCISNDKLLPVLSNQKMNAYLKEIADVCGIHKTLTFHIARHTFATTVTLSNGVPIESVSKMLGHKNLRTTQHYAKILDKKVSDDMNELKRKLNSL